MPAERPTCAAAGPGWACSRPASVAGLCEAHYRQRCRKPGSPPRQIRRSPGLVALKVRLRPETVEALAERGPTAQQAARIVIEKWAAKGR